MIATTATTKEQIAALLDELPDEALTEVVSFVEYQRFKLRSRIVRATRPHSITPVKLEGLSSGADISEEEIANLRREMWGGIEDGFE